MNLPNAFLLSLLILAVICPMSTENVHAQPATAAPAADFYVAPNGNDTWSGTLPQPNAAKSDGPFATLEQARLSLRRLAAQKPRTVLVRGGFYPLTQTFVLNSEDSGSADAPVVYAAYPGETPVFSGGVPLAGWKRVAPRIWETTVPEATGGRWRFQQLYVDGERRFRPRVPANGYFFIADELPPSPKTDGKGFDQFRYRPGDIYTSWQNRRDIEVLPFHLWTMSRFPIGDIDPATQTLTVTGQTRNTQWFSKMPRNGRYLVENVQEAIGAPGSWYLDGTTGVVTYVQLDRENPDKPDKTQIIAPRLEKLVEVNGASHVRFEGLTFAHSAWYIAPEGNSFVQAEVPVSSAVTLTGARDITFARCTFRNLGNYAVHFARGTQRCRLDGCELLDLGGGGVKMGEMQNFDDPEQLASHNTVRDCLIAEGGRVHTASVGIWIGHSPHNTIEHNEIVDFYYTGISIGWSWGYNPSGAHHNTIAYNHIHKIGQGVLSDMGGIYTLGVSPGTVLHHNRIHDIQSIEYGGWGIYFDEGTTGMVAENNVVYNTTSAPFHQHYGKENIVRNNILAFGKEAQLMRTRAEDHLSFTLENNIVYFSEGPLLGSNWQGDRFQLNRNLYWHAGNEPITFAGATLEEWKARGFDSGSLIADPRFVAPERGDFTLKPDSPALKLGFRPIDIRKAGRLTGKPYDRNVPSAFPPPPPPQPIRDSFENNRVGERPIGATVVEESAVPAAVIRVTDETAAEGKHSLKFTDAPGQKASYNPHLYYTTRIESGKVTGSFALRLEPGAVLSHEWRDRESPYHVGPSLRVTGTGELIIGEQKRMDLPLSQWVTLEISCVVGSKANGKWELIVRTERETKKFKDLPCGAGAQFRRLNWWGFVSGATTDTVFYLDNLALRPE
ncbi:MAG: right-handed parallel beta-helix repeat-containing protein [Armatimonadaceae bacterium]